MSKTKTLVEAIIKSRDYVTANELASSILQERVQTAIDKERKSAFQSGQGHILGEAKDDKKCEMCGSNKGLKTAPDGTVMCRECDVED